MSEEKNVLKISGMTCTGCAATIKKALEKEGATNVFVDFSMGEAVFQKPHHIPIERFIRAIERNGYIVKDEEVGNIHTHPHKVRILFMICVVFTVPLLAGMWINAPFLHLFMVQWILATPVVGIGVYHFGRGAVQSLIQKVPNMEVLILTGSLAAYVYSIYGWLVYHAHQYMFFETAASIITFIMLGNFIEQYSVHKTTLEIKKLQKSNDIKLATKKVKTKEKIDYQNVSVDDLVIGDILLIKEGEQVPLDCKILEGEVEVNESIITGESIPVYKKPYDELIAGTTLVKGSAEACVIRRKSETILAQIVEIVKRAQRDKPSIQKLGDKISAIFVPAVIIIAIFTFVVNNWLLNDVSKSMLQAIAVLVISCPCAMGLAAPTAVAVALGIAAKHRILFKASAAFEWMEKSKVFVFDKTGTLTTGQFSIEKFDLFSEAYSKEEILSLVYSAESRSLHPVAKSLSRYCMAQNVQAKQLTEFREEKGLAVSFKEYNDVREVVYRIGSYRILKADDARALQYDVFVTANDQLIAAFKLKDELRPQVKTVLQCLLARGKEIVLLSGDRKDKCFQIADELGLAKEQVFYEQLPDDKLKVIEQLKRKGLVCMVGDGINDAPAMAKADVSISFNHSSSIAIDSASVIISHPEVLEKLKMAILLSERTMRTIRQNYFWAFFYNVIAIPVAAMGMLMPIIAALCMTVSDIIVVGNSLSIYRKRLN